MTSKIVAMFAVLALLAGACSKPRENSEFVDSQLAAFEDKLDSIETGFKQKLSAQSAKYDESYETYIKNVNSVTAEAERRIRAAVLSAGKNYANSVEKSNPGCQIAAIKGKVDLEKAITAILDDLQKEISVEQSNLLTE